MLPQTYVSNGQPYEVPVYRLVGDIFMDDILWLEGEEIVFDGTPNDAMAPLNAAAEKRTQAWMASLPKAGTDNAQDLVQAAWDLQPKNGEKPEDFQAFWLKTMERAYQLKQSRSGHSSPQAQPMAMPRSKAEVPPMPNTNYHTGSMTPPPRRGRPPTVKHLPQGAQKSNVPATGAMTAAVQQLPES